MDNLKSPAHPTITNPKHDDLRLEWLGFTKLEFASLMMAQGMFRRYDELQHGPETLAKDSVLVAKLVLEEANK